MYYCGAQMDNCEAILVVVRDFLRRFPGGQKREDKTRIDRPRASGAHYPSPICQISIAQTAIPEVQSCIIVFGTSI